MDGLGWIRWLIKHRHYTHKKLLTLVLAQLDRVQPCWCAKCYDCWDKTNQFEETAKADKRKISYNVAAIHSPELQTERWKWRLQWTLPRFSLATAWSTVSGRRRNQTCRPWCHYRWSSTPEPETYTYSSYTRLCSGSQIHWHLWNLGKVTTLVTY